MTRSRNHGIARFATFGCLALIVGWAATASAQITSTWNTTTDVFTTSGNWTHGVPGSGDTAVFDNNATYTVDGFGTGVTNAHAIIGNTTGADGIDVTFDLGGQTWALTSDASVDHENPSTSHTGLNVGNVEVGPVTMRVTNGTLETGGYVVGRTGTTSPSTLILSGAGTVMTSSATDGSSHAQHHSSIGYYNNNKDKHTRARGILRIEDGAKANLGMLGVFSATPTQQSKVVITGTNSELTVSTGTAYFVYYSDLDITHGGKFSAPAFTFQHNNVLVESGTILTPGLMNMLAAVMTVKSQSTVEAGRIALGWAASSLIVESGSTVTSTTDVVAEAAHNNMGGGVTVRGADSADSKVNIGRDLILARNTHASDELSIPGYVKVEAWGEVTVGRDLIVSDRINNTYVGLVDVGGTLARLEVTGTANIGGTDSASGSRADVNVTAGGELDAKGTLRLWDTVELTTDAGRIKAQTLDMKSGAKWYLTLQNSDLGDTLIGVTGSASIDGAELHLALAGDYVAELNDLFTLMQVNGTLTGTFAGLTDGDTVASNLGANADLWMVINYNTPGNDSITLTVIPEPGVAGLLLAGLGGLLFIRRRLTRP